MSFAKASGERYLIFFYLRYLPEKLDAENLQVRFFEGPLRTDPMNLRIKKL